MLGQYDTDKSRVQRFLNDLVTKIDREDMALVSPNRSSTGALGRALSNIS